MGKEDTFEKIFNPKRYKVDWSGGENHPESRRAGKEPPLVWGPEPLINDTSYHEEDTAAIEYKNESWFLNGKKVSFEDLGVRYSMQLRGMALKDDKLKRILEKESNSS